MNYKDYVVDAESATWLDKHWSGTRKAYTTDTPYLIEFVALSSSSSSGAHVGLCMWHTTMLENDEYHTVYDATTGTFYGFKLGKKCKR